MQAQKNTWYVQFGQVLNKLCPFEVCNPNADGGANNDGLNKVSTMVGPTKGSLDGSGQTKGLTKGMIKNAYVYN